MILYNKFKKTQNILSIYNAIRAPGCNAVAVKCEIVKLADGRDLSAVFY